MKKKKKIAEFNTRLDPDSGYPDHISLNTLLKLLQFQHDANLDTGITPLVQVKGDSISLYHEVECSEEEYDEAYFSEMEDKIDRLKEEAAELGFELKQV